MDSNRRTAPAQAPSASDLFRLLIESVRDYAIYVLDADGRVVGWGKGAERVKGHSEADVLGRHFGLFYPEADVAAGKPQADLLAAHQRGRFEDEGWRVRKNGERFWASVVITALVDGDGKLQGFGKITRDTTERHLSDGMLRAAIDSAIDGIVTIDERGKVSSFSKGAERMFGYTAAQVLGQNVRMLMPDELAQAHDGFLAAYLQTGVARIIGKGREVTGRRSDGTLFPIDLAITEFTSREQHYFVGVVRDISERKRLEARLLAAQKLQVFGQMAGGVAHDFNNLLTVILGNTEHAMERVRHLPEECEPLQMVVDAGMQAAALTRQLLAFRRDGDGPPKEVLLNDVVVHSLRMLRRLVGNQVEIVTVLDDLLPMLLADQNQLGQVLLNLAVNARDAMPDGGRLTIRTLTVEIPTPPTPADPPLVPGQYVLLAVSDTGLGMQRAVRQRLFEPFFTTKDAGRGNGLGLAIVCGIVQQCGGHVEVDSAPGGGTTFWIYLPAARIDGIEPEPTTFPAPSLIGDETVLLLVDDPSWRREAEQTLRRLGYQPILARDDDEAIAVGMNAEIHLLVTDLTSGHRGIRPAAAALTASRPELRVLYVGDPEHDVVLEPAPRRIGYLDHPFARHELAVKVRDLLELRADGR